MDETSLLKPSLLPDSLVHYEMFETNLREFEEPSNSTSIVRNNESKDSQTKKDETQMEIEEIQEVSSEINQTSTLTRTLELTTINFNVSPFEELRKKIKTQKRGNKETHLKFRRVKPTKTVKKRTMSFKVCKKYESRFYLTFGEMKMCENYKHIEVNRKTSNDSDSNKKTLKKKRNPFIMALIYVLKIKYSELNNRCKLNIWSHNQASYGWTFYGWCIFKTCRYYKFKVTKIRDSTGSNLDEELMYQVEVFVDRLNVITHDSKNKVGYVKGKYFYLYNIFFHPFIGS